MPHVTEESLKYFTGKKRHIKTVQQFAQLPKSERRNILKHLSDEQFSDVEKVLIKMPFIDFQYKSEGDYNCSYSNKRIKYLILFFSGGR